MIGIYKITNPNSDVYIGSTRNIAKRRANYKTKKNQGRLILGSVVKYGWDNHVFEVVHELPIDVSQNVLDTYEQTYIDLYKDAGCVSLNIREAGKRGSHSKDTKIRMSISATGRKTSNETKKKISISKMGTIVSDETRRKLSIARFGRVTSEETKKKLSIGKTRGRHNLAKKVIDTENGYIYDCRVDAAIQKGIKYSTLGAYLTGRLTNKTTLKYL